jgi:hypothetical protein
VPPEGRRLARRLKPLRLTTVLALGLFAACAPLKPSGPIPGADVIVWGDSFAEGATPWIATGTEIRAYGGTSPCDWESDVVNTVEEGRAPTTAVFLFVGNHATTCNYSTIATLLTAALQSAGTRVVWMAAPPMPCDTGADPNPLNRAYPNPAYGPANAVASCGYRAADKKHLTPAGYQRLAAEINTLL